MSDIYPIAVPKWGIEMVEGTITTWNKSEGDGRNNFQVGYFSDMQVVPKVRTKMKFC